MSQLWKLSKLVSHFHRGARINNLQHLSLATSLSG